MRADEAPDTRRGRPLLLVLRALGLGDLLTAIPALRALADAFPDHRRVLAAPTPLAPLAMATGAIHAVYPAAPLALWRPDGSGPDIAVNLQNNAPHTYRALLATRPPRLIGFAHAEIPETTGFPVPEKGEHEVHRWCRLLVEHGIPADPSRLDLHLEPGEAPSDAQGATLLHPGGSSAARRWPVDRWAAVARSLTADGRKIVITGKAEEADLVREIASLAGLDEGEVWDGPTDVMQLTRLVATVARTVSGDTGVAHLATALGTPSVILFGDHHLPSRWGPPSDRPWHRVICSDDRETGESGVRAIGVTEVLEALEDLPRSPRRQTS